MESQLLMYLMCMKKAIEIVNKLLLIRMLDLIYNFKVLKDPKELKLIKFNL